MLTKPQIPYLYSLSSGNVIGRFQKLRVVLIEKLKQVEAYKTLVNINNNRQTIPGTLQRKKIYLLQTNQKKNELKTGTHFYKKQKQDHLFILYVNVYVRSAEHIFLDNYH